MNQLDEIYQQCQNSEKNFKFRAVLYVGNEAYDAVTITVLQGLQRLGFTIYALKKPNINSWFCNRVVESIDRLNFDFVLSNLHCGTRWSYYERYHLHAYPKILIDGDDYHGEKNWREKFARYCRKYTYDPPDALKDMLLHPYRWVESLGSYQPDIVFTSQKPAGDTSSFYLPFGIQYQYNTLYEGRSTADRDIDIAHIPGLGTKRERLTENLGFLKSCKILPGVIHIDPVRGDEMVPVEIRDAVIKDYNVHSYHRWPTSRAYFRLLNRTKILLYPGVNPGSWWDSKRPWESYASGCLVMFERPEVDMAGYPVTDICDFAVYNSTLELVEKCWYLHRKPGFQDKLRTNAVASTWQYFSPEAISRYFLHKIWIGLN